MRKLCIPDISFVALDGNGKLQKVGAAQQLLQIASAPSGDDRTVSIAVLRQRLSLVDKLAAVVETNGKEVLLESEEYKTLLELMQASTWGGVSHAANDLVEAVEKAETVEVAEVEPQESSIIRRRDPSR